MGERVWGYSDSPDPDMWSEHYPTKEDAIAAAEQAYSDTDDIYVIDGEECGPTAYMPTAEDIREIMEDRASDELGSDAASDYPGVSEEALEELDALLLAWARKHVTSGVWLADGCPQLVREARRG